MARKRTARSWIGMIIFILVVIESGIGLSGGRFMPNPFQVFADIAALKDEIRLDDTSIDLRPQPRIAPSGVTFVDTGVYDVTLHWSEFRGVLFDWWFIAVVTVVIMFIGRPIGMLLKKLRS